MPCSAKRRAPHRVAPDGMSRELALVEHLGGHRDGPRCAPSAASSQPREARAEIDRSALRSAGQVAGDVDPCVGATELDGADTSARRPSRSSRGGPVGGPRGRSHQPRIARRARSLPSSSSSRSGARARRRSERLPARRRAAVRARGPVPPGASPESTSRGRSQVAQVSPRSSALVSHGSRVGSSWGAGLGVSVADVRGGAPPGRRQEPRRRGRGRSRSRSCPRASRWRGTVLANATSSHASARTERHRASKPLLGLGPERLDPSPPKRHVSENES